MRSRLVPLLLLSLATSGCYAVHPPAGGGRGVARSPRPVSPSDVAVPCEYIVDTVATGLTYPSGLAFDEQGVLYVLEAGYAYGEAWAEARLVKVEPGGRLSPVASGGRGGPWNGVAYGAGAFFVAEGGQLAGGKILRIGRDGAIRPLVENLPSVGDHHTNGPALGPDGWLYFGQGTATNSGVVGEDSAKFGWLERHPRFADIPARDVVLRGENFETEDVRTPEAGDRALTGAYVPFGTPTRPGQVIRGRMPCTGAVLRVRPEGGTPELVAWGLRNPFGFAFGPGGALYVTDNGYDERGSRPVFGSGDFLWRLQPGLWYGWPDYVGGAPAFQEDYRGPCARCPPKLLQVDPNPPPRAVAILDVHSSSNGIDVSRSPSFGHVGEAFIAQFGDMAPGVGKVMNPVGFKVVRVNLQNGVIEDFAVNRGFRNGPASLVGGGGLERPVAVRFDPSGAALYVVDFGVMTTAGGKPNPIAGTGVVWRIRRGAVR